jgi:hypothetical protein
LFPVLPLPLSFSLIVATFLSTSLDFFLFFPSCFLSLQFLFFFYSNPSLSLSILPAITFLYLLNCFFCLFFISLLFLSIISFVISFYEIIRCLLGLFSLHAFSRVGRYNLPPPPFQIYGLLVYWLSQQIVPRPATGFGHNLLGRVPTG